MRLSIREKALALGLVALGGWGVAGAQTPTAEPQADIVEVAQPDFLRVLRVASVSSKMPAVRAHNLRFEIAFDGKIDATERAVLDRLKAPTYDFRVRPVSAETPRPADVRLKGSMADDARDILFAPWEPDFARAAGPAPDETRSNYLLRRRDEGFREIGARLSAEPGSVRELRETLAVRLSTEYAAARQEDWQRADNVIANQINGWLAAARRTQTEPQFAAFKQTLREAAAAANRHGGLSLTSSLALFSSPQTARAEADAILAQLGLQ